MTTPNPPTPPVVEFDTRAPEFPGAGAESPWIDLPDAPALDWPAGPDWSGPGGFAAAVQLGHWLDLGGPVLLTATAYRAMQKYGVGVSYWRSNPNSDTAANIRRAAKIRRGWPRLARNLGLILEDRSPNVADRLAGRTKHKDAIVRAPRIVSATPDEWGVSLVIATVPGVALEHFAKRAKHLADAWDMREVAARQLEPGRLLVRAVRTDPLTAPLNAEMPRRLPNLERIAIGPDSRGEKQYLVFKNASGIGIFGTPGFGKSAFIRGLIADLAPSRCVQFMVMDGKSETGLEGDYQDTAPRIHSVLGDDLEQARNLLQQLVALRKMRSATIRAERGSANFWNLGATEDWPLIIPIMDECHTYFQIIKNVGNNETLKARNALVSEIVLLVEDLVKKGRSVGIVMILATQKGTADAMPTAIRDVLTTSISFAVRTGPAAIAALGPEISEFPDADPRTLLRDEFRGVGVIASEGATGFVKFRAPWMPESLALAVCEKTAGYVIDLPGITVGRGHRAAAPDTPAALLTMPKATSKATRGGQG